MRALVQNKAQGPEREGQIRDQKWQTSRLFTMASSASTGTGFANSNAVFSWAASKRSRTCARRDPGSQRSLCCEFMRRDAPQPRQLPPSSAVTGPLAWGSLSSRWQRKLLRLCLLPEVQLGCLRGNFSLRHGCVTLLPMNVSRRTIRQWIAPSASPVRCMSSRHAARPSAYAPQSSL